tara:strand:- start:194590 stop:195678 length:1089 start_codon:yes stop_codon:yes gene_type:complete
MASVNDAHSCKVITSIGALAPYERQWESLNAKMGPEALFTQYAAIRCNWDRYSNDRGFRLHIFMIFDADESLVFAAPMLRRYDFLLGTFAFQWLNSKTPLYDDLLLSPEADLQTIAARFYDHLHQHLFARKLKIDCVRDGSALDRILRALDIPLLANTSAPVVDISTYADWDDYLAKKAAKSRQKFHSLQRHLAKSGGYCVEHLVDPAEIRSEIGRIFDRKRQWVGEDEGRTDWIVPAEAENWFQDFCATCLQRGEASVLRLTCGQEWVSSVLFFARGDTVFLSKISHNPVWEKWSPGWIIAMELCNLAISGGYHKLDLMIGNHAWKKRFTGTKSRISTCRFPLGVGWLGKKSRQGPCTAPN